MDNIKHAVDSLIDETLSYLSTYSLNPQSFLVSKESYDILAITEKKTRRPRIRPHENTHVSAVPAPSSPVKPVEIKKEPAPPKEKLPLEKLEPVLQVKEEVTESSLFRLEKLAPKAPDAFTDLFALMERLFPDTPLNKEDPDDTLAKVPPKRTIDLPAVVIFHKQTSPKEIEFLNNLSTAITRELKPCGLFFLSSLEKDEVKEMVLHETPVLFISLNPTEDPGSPLLPYYRENPSSFTSYLGNKIFVSLRPIEEYFSQPKLKKALWHSLCQILKN